MYDLLVGDCLELLQGLPDDSIHCCVTSPPYFNLRDYLNDAQIGREQTPDEYVRRLVAVFRQVRRVLRPDGTLWLNVGDSYSNSERLRRPSGIKRKDLCGIPWRLAFALQADGWHLRCDVIWQKSNSTPESTQDRPSRSHEYVFLLSKRPRYFYDREAVREPNASARPRGRKGVFLEGRDAAGLEKWSKAGRWAESAEAHGGFVSWNPRGRNRRSVWTSASSNFLPKTVGVDDVTHFAAYPTALVTPCILAGTAPGCCPVCGAPYKRQVAGQGAPPDADLWRPSCGCPHKEPAPCRVLDPFLGTGTTAVAAIENGRNCVGIELNPDYARLAQARCNKALSGRRDVWAGGAE